MDTFNLARQTFNSELGPFFCISLKLSREMYANLWLMLTAATKEPVLPCCTGLPCRRCACGQHKALCFQQEKLVQNRQWKLPVYQRLVLLAREVKAKEKWFKILQNSTFYSNKTIAKSKMSHEAWCKLTKLLTESCISNWYFQKCIARWHIDGI